MKRVIVLYEDAGIEGLHNLVCALVANALHTVESVPPWALVKVPRKGDSKLLESVRGDVERLAPKGEPVFALFDRDQVHVLLKVKHGACHLALRTAVGPTAACVVFLNRNQESILAALRDHLDFEGEALERGLKKNVTSRNIVLNKAAACSAADLDKLRNAVPSLAYFADKIAAAIAKP